MKHLFLLFIIAMLCMLFTACSNTYRNTQSQPEHWRSDNMAKEGREHNVTVRERSLDTMTMTQQKGTDRAPYPVITEKFTRDVQESHKPSVEISR